MSSGDILVELEERTILKKGLQHLRAEGKIPAVIHDHGKPSSHVMASVSVLTKAYSSAGKHHPVHLTVGSTKHLALIKDVDFDPVKHQMRHVVFQAIRQNEAVEAEIPIVFLADTDIPAEKQSLLVLRQLDHAQVKALPRDLPDELVVDPSKLVEVGDHITVADIIVPEGVTILTDPGHPIATVEMPKDQLAEADASAAALAEDADKGEDADKAETAEGETATPAEGEPSKTTEESKS